MWKIKFKSMLGDEDVNNGKYFNGFGESSPYFTSFEEAKIINNDSISEEDKVDYNLNRLYNEFGGNGSNVLEQI